MEQYLNKPKGRKSNFRKAKSMSKSKRAKNTSDRLPMKRMPFLRHVLKQMEVKSGLARCHTISWETISKNISELSEYFLNGKIDVEAFWLEMVKLWYAVTGEMKPSEEYIKNIIYFLNGNGNRQEWLNNLGRELNSCMSNLRLGNSGTNSSIQGGLDIPICYKSPLLTPLPAGTLYTTEWLDSQNGFTNVSCLEKDEQVLLIKDLFLIKRLIALLSIHDSVEPYIYTTGNQVQSSDYPNMNKGDKLLPGCRIGFDIKDGFYYLFSKEE